MVLLIVLTVVAIAVFLFANRKKVTTAVAGSGTDAFSKIASAEGKIVAAKAAAEKQFKDALDVHKDIDAVHNLLG
jgi:hypothetical protein